MFIVPSKNETCDRFRWPDTGQLSLKKWARSPVTLENRMSFEGSIKRLKGLVRDRYPNDPLTAELNG